MSVRIVKLRAERLELWLCKGCGAVVADKRQHSRWHEQHDEETDTDG